MGLPAKIARIKFSSRSVTVWEQLKARNEMRSCWYYFVLERLSFAVKILIDCHNNTWRLELKLST
jgi:hypothetical protein